MRGLQAVSIDQSEVAEPWWSEQPESDEQMDVRIGTLLQQIKHAPADAIVVVGHSHFYRAFCQRVLHPVLRRRETEMVDRLQTTSIPNGTLLCLELDFDREPYVCVHVSELELAREDSKLPTDEASGERSATQRHTSQGGREIGPKETKHSFGILGKTIGNKVSSKLKSEQTAKGVDPRMIAAMQEARRAP